MAYNKHSMKVWILEDEAFRITGAHVSVLKRLYTRQDWKVFISQLTELLGDSMCPTGDTDGIYYIAETEKSQIDNARSLTATRVFTDSKKNLKDVPVPSGNIGAFSLHSIDTARVGVLVLQTAQTGNASSEIILFGVPMSRSKGPVRIDSYTQKMLDAMGETLQALLRHES